MKIKCSGCLEELGVINFGINVNSKTGYCTQCKTCLSLAPFKPHRFKRTLFKTLNNKDCMSFTDFKDWLYNTNYDKLYKKWVKSNYSKEKRPSISKVDTDFEWKLDNIRLTTFKKRTFGHKKTEHTRKGLIANIYNNQKKSSRKRGHKSPNYTISQLIKWVLNQDNFETIYKRWVKSNYKSKKRPSLDRIKDELSYTFDNINLTTWKHNHSRGVESNKVKASIRVKQYNLKGELLNKYKSMSEASRETGISSGAISNACNKERPNVTRAGGFKWITY